MTIQPYICQDHACPSRERCVYHRPKGFGTDLSVKAFGREPNEHKCAEFIQRAEITEWESVRRNFRGEPMMDTEYVILEYTSNDKLEEDLTTYSEDGYSLVSLNSDTAVLKRPPDECTVWGGPLNGQSISMREALECWGVNLLENPISGIARATEFGRKHGVENWNNVCLKARNDQELNQARPGLRLE